MVFSFDYVEAPGFDGLLYQQEWELINEDFCKVFKDFYDRRDHRFFHDGLSCVE